MKNNNNKWMKGLDRDLIKRILDINPSHVGFTIKWGYAVRCEIIDKERENVGVGISICSTIDEFDLNRGKNIAAGRARKALVKKQSSGHIREAWHQFPDTWRKAQIKRVMEHSHFDNKSTFLPKEA